MYEHLFLLSEQIFYWIQNWHLFSIIVHLWKCDLCAFINPEFFFIFFLDNRKSVSKTRMKPSEHISHSLIEELKFNCDRGPTGIVFMTVFSFHPTRLRRGQTGSEDQIREWSGKHTFFSQSEDVVLKRHFDRETNVQQRCHQREISSKPPGMSPDSGAGMNKLLSWSFMQPLKFLHPAS